MRWGAEPFVDGLDDEERWRGEEDGESWISLTWEENVMKKSSSAENFINLVLLDSSAFPEYLLLTPFDIEPNDQEGVELLGFDVIDPPTLVTSTPSLSSCGSLK